MDRIHYELDAIAQMINDGNFWIRVCDAREAAGVLGDA
jgi:hypothetical protein